MSEWVEVHRVSRLLQGPKVLNTGLKQSCSTSQTLWDAGSLCPKWHGTVVRALLIRLWDTSESWYLNLSHQEVQAFNYVIGNWSEFLP